MIQTFLILAVFLVIVCWFIYWMFIQMEKRLHNELEIISYNLRKIGTERLVSEIKNAHDDKAYLQMLLNNMNETKDTSC